MKGKWISLLSTFLYIWHIPKKKKSLSEKKPYSFKEAVVEIDGNGYHPCIWGKHWVINSGWLYTLDVKLSTGYLKTTTKRQGVGWASPSLTSASQTGVRAPCPLLEGRQGPGDRPRPHSAGWGHFLPRGPAHPAGAAGPSAADLIWGHCQWYQRTKQG